jgi:hypothetical protein
LGPVPVPATLPYLRHASTRLFVTIRACFFAVVNPGILAAAADMGASRSARQGQPAPRRPGPPMRGGAIGPRAAPNAKSCQLATSRATSGQPTLPWPRSRASTARYPCLSRMPPHAAECQTRLTKKIPDVSNQSVTAGDLVNLRLTLNFLPREPNR